MVRAILHMLAGSSVARRRVCATACALLLLPACAIATTYSDVERVVAISDVHGAYGSMVNTLTMAGVVDTELNWSGGTTHLVITGDLLDRGADSRKVMDLVMRIEDEAQQDGGRVHLLLGNHEVMNLIGDLRYVAKGEFAAFAGEELPEEREKWLQHYLAAAATQQVLAGSSGNGIEDVISQDAGAEYDEAALREEFARLAPPGFFAHRRGFAADGHYGKWLLEKPLIVVIDRTAFVHGGLPPLVAELGLDGINEQLGSDATNYTRQMNLLNDADVLNPVINFYEHKKELQAISGAAAPAPEIAAAIETLSELRNSSINNSTGPLWYRGTVGCGPVIESDRIDAALAALGADRVVIGHTPTITRHVLRRLDGRVIEIDTGMLVSSYKGVGNALVIEGDKISVVNEVSGTDAKIVEHPRRVGMRADSLNAAALEELLSSGEIVSTRENDAGRILVEFEANGETITAEFIENPRSKGFVPELAAYRLDRLLELDMVPVTARRELNGDSGVLQFVPPGLSNEGLRSVSGRGGSAWCPIQLQWPAMYVWDTLTYNPGRAPQNILYSTDNWQLILNAHQDSFVSRQGRPPWLQQAELSVTGGWVAALTALTDEALQEHLGDVLDKRKLSALRKRRDQLLSEANP